MRETRTGESTLAGAVTTTNPIRRTTVVGQVMERFKELIASGQYRPNDRLPTEAELSSIFGVGRSTIREAVKIFQYLGILRTQAAKGTFVCSSSNVSAEALTWSILLGKNDMYEMLQLRRVLEESAIKSVVRGLDIGDTEAINTASNCADTLQSMKVAMDDFDIEGLVDSDYQFHHQIVQGSKNGMFISIFETLRAFTREQIKKTYREESWRKSVLNHHWKILNAIKAHNENEAIAAYHVHLDTTLRKLRAAMQQAR